MHVTKNRNKLKYGWCAVLVAVLVTAVAGCGVDSDDGDDRNTVGLAFDDTVALDLYCANIGVFPDRCVLEDPANPYRFSIVTEDTKFDLAADAPSETARFYLWATALAKGAGIPGEDQYNVALSLQRLWGSSNSELTRLQALKAYRAYLDNFFDSIRFREEPPNSGNIVPRNLNKATGQNLFNPAGGGNQEGSTDPLFNPDPAINADEAAKEVGDWGYTYDQVNEIFSQAP